MKIHFAVIALVILFTGCKKKESIFFEDDDDPGLSKVTDRGYNVSSAYVNDAPWVMFDNYSQPFIYGPSYLRNNYLILQPGGGTGDTLHLGWRGRRTNPDFVFTHRWEGFENLTLSIPVPAGFTLGGLYAFRGQRFPDNGINVQISFGNSQVPDSSSVKGSGKLYFIESKANGSLGYFNVSGLFEGRIGDSIVIRKGRFDNNFMPTDHNLQ